MALEDNYRHKGLRKKLIEEIRKKGIVDEPLLRAMGKIPRHFFLDSGFLEYAYEDKPFPIGSGQTISQPYTVAYQTQLLEVRKADKILEIGTGSGYQACILAELGARVFTIERQKLLFQKAKEFLPAMRYPIKLFYGDGYKGLPSFAPFDKILITAAAPYIPDVLKEQLKPGGMIVVPVGSGDIQIMTRLTKISDTDFEITEYGHFRFVPLLEDKAEDC
ncbi:MAG: protein-L-isoaspartate(D-aspartate) O-methyltransferase [Bacteroidetes bacterium]|nr:protein-L-isoaspartate(D-aspartate) O-methyltransferase [Bacteroidota bacterium]